MNIDQHAALQPRIVETQRLALHLAELGESKASRLLVQATVVMQRLRPAKPAEEQGTTAPKKGRGAQ